MDLDVDLLATTFEAASRADPDFATTFYTRFTLAHPEVTAFFRGEVTLAQKRMFVGALVAILARLDDPTWLVTTLPPLGREHLARGIVPEMYGWFSRCLVGALAAAAGEEWSEAAEVQWGAALALVSTLMIQGPRDDDE